MGQPDRVPNVLEQCKATLWTPRKNEIGDANW